jgi:hypothetical protein
MSDAIRAKKSDSIHPRVVGGVKALSKVNTCRPSRRLARTARRVITRYDQRLMAHAATKAWCELHHVNPAAFRRPGSRNPAKLRNR